MSPVDADALCFRLRLAREAIEHAVEHRDREVADAVALDMRPFAADVMDGGDLVPDRLRARALAVGRFAGAASAVLAGRVARGALAPARVLLEAAPARVVVRNAHGDRIGPPLPIGSDLVASIAEAQRTALLLGVAAAWGSTERARAACGRDNQNAALVALPAPRGVVCGARR